MRPLHAHEIKGNWATLLLPILDNDAIDFAALGDEIDAIIDAKVDGVYSNGTAGEFHTQSDDEFDRISLLLAEKCEKAQLPFQIGASHMSAQISRERLKRAKSLKPGAFQVILPDWFGVTAEEAVDFLHTLATEAGGVGLVLYNPPHAKVRLSPETITMLASRVPSLVGVKVAAGEQEWFDRMGPTLTRLSVFTPGHFLARHHPWGSAGAYSNVACLSPAGAQRWWNMICNDPPSARRIQDRLLDFFAKHITPYITERHFCNAAADKLLAAVGGWGPVGTRLRWPYKWIPEEDARALRPLARQALPELFAG